MDLLDAVAFSGMAGAIVALASEISYVNVDELVDAMKQGAVKLGSVEQVDEARIRKIFDLVKQISNV